MFKKKKNEEVNKEQFHLDKESMEMGKLDQKPPISVKRFLKRKLIFLLIFILIVVGVLVFLIERTNNPKIINDNKVATNTTSNEIEIAVKPQKEYKYTYKNEWFYNNQIRYSLKELTDKKCKIEYFEIDGLSNTSLQKSINEKMLSYEKQLAEQLSKKYPHVDGINLDTYVAGNFANIFSVEIDANVYTNSEQIHSGRYFYTINLIDGKKVFFEDVVDNNELKSILLKYGYLSLAKNYVNFDNGTGDEIFDNTRAGNLEEDVYQFINDVLNHSSKVTMGIGSGSIAFSYINDEDEVYTNDIVIPLGEINKKEYVYNRYVGQNIYNKKYEKVGPFPVYMGNSANIINVVYEKGDNYFINLIVEDNDYTFNENNDDFWARINDIARKLANESISKADKDKSRFYYLTAHFKGSADDDNNLGGTYANIVRNNYLTKELFDSEVYNHFLLSAQEFTIEGMCEGYTMMEDVGNPEHLYEHWEIDFAGNIIDKNGDL